MQGHRFLGDPDMLRSPARVALLEPSRVVTACIEGMKARTVLDVGTGTGLFAEYFLGRGLSVTGVDVEPRMSAKAMSMVAGAEFAAAPAEDLPYGDRTFDLVFLGLVLHEADDARRALREAARVSRWRVAILEWPYTQSEFGPTLAHRLSPQQIRSLVKTAGLELTGEQRLTHVQLYLASAPVLGEHPQVS